MSGVLLLFCGLVELRHTYQTVKDTIIRFCKSIKKSLMVITIIICVSAHKHLWGYDIRVFGPWMTSPLDSNPRVFLVHRLCSPCLYRLIRLY